MKIKTTTRFHLIPEQLKSITQVTIHALEDVEHSSIASGSITWETVWWLLRKIRINLPQYPDIPFLGICPKDTSSYHEEISSTTLTAALVIIVRN